jgi:hypothetical protein
MIALRRVISIILLASGIIAAIYTVGTAIGSGIHRPDPSILIPYAAMTLIAAGIMLGNDMLK